MNPSLVTSLLMQGIEKPLNGAILMFIVLSNGPSRARQGLGSRE